MMTKLYVQYARISTNEEKQANGMEVQRIAMDNFVKQNDGTTIAIFEEYESGGNNNRKEIKKAIALAKEKKAILLVSKLDRLGRNMRFILEVRDEIGFVAVDNPSMSGLMLGILASFAEEEKKVISERTKAGMQVAKSKGKNIGGKRWDTPPLKLLDLAKKKACEKREEMKRFIAENNDIIKGDPKVLVRLLAMNGYKNHLKNDYNILNLKRLGLLEFIENKI